jgi:uncharacterized membrane protein
MRASTFRSMRTTAALLPAALAALAAIAAPPTAASPSRAASFSIPGALYGVAATSPGDAWAVGVSDASGTLIVHWNGAAWLQVPSPSPGVQGSYTSLSGVAATAADDAWAVGSSLSSVGSRVVERTVILHWNGVVWTKAPAPSPGTFAGLDGVAATSPRSAWAVGFDRGGALILHWNGTAWTQVRTRIPHGALESVAVPASARSAWAVGIVGTGGGTGVPATNHSLIVHWNGVTWKQVPTHLAPGLSNLRGVAATSSSNAWAVGCSGCSAEGAGAALIERWNGRAWRVVSAPNGTAGLFGVAATSASNAWAVGVPTGAAGRTSGIMHWNGRAWKLVPSPNPAGAEHVLGVTALSPTHAWAVGETEATTPFEGVISGWNGAAWN